MFNSQTSLLKAAAGMAALAAGCAQAPKLPPAPQPQVAVGSVLAREAQDSTHHWLDSRASVAVPQGWVRYDVQYVVDGGDLLPRLVDDSVAPLIAAPRHLGGDLLKQSLETRLPSLAGGQPRLSLSSSDGTLWTVDGETRRDQQQARLAWNPEPLDLQLQWSAPRSVSDASRPLDCIVGGSVDVSLAPLGVTNQSLLLGARGCNVDSPGRAAAGLDVESWTGAWQFGKPALRHKLALTLLETQSEAEQALPADPAATGYELRLSQTRSRGRWVGDSAVGWRRVVDPLGPVSDDWTAQASLKRQVHRLGVTAGWQRDADPLWFMPGVARPVDQLALGLDFKPWLTQVWGVPDLVKASMSYRWNQSSDPALDGGGVYWNLAKAW
jgi:hypothetical protein